MVKIRNTKDSSQISRHKTSEIARVIFDFGRDAHDWGNMKYPSQENSQAYVLSARKLTLMDTECNSVRVRMIGDALYRP
jgi:hypothetical protein